MPPARPQVVVDRSHLSDQLGAWVGARIRCVQAWLIGEYQQQVGLDQIGHQRRQRVVVAQLDLVGSYRVVFVDYGHDALRQQRLQGIAGVEVAAAVVEIGPRQQHLAHDDVVDAEELLVVLHEPDLADCGQHLFGGHGLRKLAKPQAGSTTARQRPTSAGAWEKASGCVSTADQMLAAVGQVRLMQHYEQLFGIYNIVVGQVLLTRSDLNHRSRYLNARDTLQALLAERIVPVINENDTVATDEIKLGDNDTLSALVSNLVEADLLLILTDQPGLYTADPRTDPTPS